MDRTTDGSNFVLDHIDKLKGFRSGSNISAITSRIRVSLMDTLNEIKDYRTPDKSKHSDPDSLESGITDLDLEYIFQKKALALHQGGLAWKKYCTIQSFLYL